MCVIVLVVVCLYSLIYQFTSIFSLKLECSWWSVLYLVKMKCGSLSNYLISFFRTLFIVIDAFLNLREWMICWHIFNKYLVGFENNDPKCTHCSSIDDNTNSCNFFTDSISTCKWPFSRHRVGDSILVIMYDIQACTSVTPILCKNKSLLIRPYDNCLSLSDMLGESVFSSNLWLNPQCGK